MVLFMTDRCMHACYNIAPSATVTDPFLWAQNHLIFKPMWHSYKMIRYICNCNCNTTVLWWSEFFALIMVYKNILSALSYVNMHARKRGKVTYLSVTKNPVSSAAPTTASLLGCRVGGGGRGEGGREKMRLIVFSLTNEQVLKICSTYRKKKIINVRYRRKKK